MKKLDEFTPKLFSILRSGYSFATFKKDFLAGITVGIISIPLAMAFAMASGTSPDRGIFTAIIAGFLISALGGSRAQIGGPTGAFVVIVYDIMQRTGYEGLAVSTLIAAVLLVIFGLFRIGTWIKFVSHPLATGFTTGIALIIFSSQIKDFFGLQITALPPAFWSKWSLYFKTFPTFDPLTLMVSSATLFTIVLIRHFYPRVPAGICALFLATSMSYFFHLPVETIQSKFGALPTHIPLPAFPSFSILTDRFNEVFRDAVAIALLGGIESLLSAVIADGMTGQRHRSNCELVGQGIANFFSILFGGIPATGAIARTAANIKNGAETPVAGMIHAVTIFVIVLFFGPVVSQMPLAALSAVLVMIAWNMSEMKHFRHLLKAPIGDVAVLLTAFLLTVLVDITIAILLGMILSSFLFMKKMSEHSKTVSLMDKEEIAMYEIQGPFFFGSANILKDLLKSFAKPPRVFILRIQNVPTLDASGMNALREFHQICHKGKTTLLLSGVQGQNAKNLKKFGLVDLIQEQHIFDPIDAALVKADDLLSTKTS